MTKRCGTVAIIGEPNVGKSTLVNKLVGGKVSIVSPKVQTTRVNVRGICMHDDAQIVLVDTPGIFDAKKPFEQSLVKNAWAGLKEADAVLLLVDARVGIKEETRKIIARLIPSPQGGEGGHRPGGGKPILIAINKIDKVKKERLLELALECDAFFNNPLPSPPPERGREFHRIFMISAQKGDGVEDIKKYVAEKMPAGEWLYPADNLSDVPMSTLAAEITREKVFYKLSQELPYSIAVEPESWDEKKDSVKISQCILVQKENQKMIVIGKGGAMLKQIGMSARRELETLLEKKVHLSLFVKVKPDWQEKDAFLPR
jgi:GTP-binding protein Era